MASRDKKRSGKKGGVTKQYSTIDQHRRHEKTLTPPLADLEKLSLASWKNDRLPELLWCALLLSETGRENALHVFRQVAEAGKDLHEQYKNLDLGHTGLAALPAEVRSSILDIILHSVENRLALRPLLHFVGLPARSEWASRIADNPTDFDWDHLKVAVMAVLDHQSQEATDCRWARVYFMMISGQFHFDSKLEETAKEIYYYPEYGDMRKARPAVRATEGGFSGLLRLDLAWPKEFWRQCLQDTVCEPVHLVGDPAPLESGTTRDTVRSARHALADHYHATLVTTDVDARHDGCFGIAGAALGILEELLAFGNSTGILGQMGLRSLLEHAVNLAYLTKYDDTEKWRAYRIYGAGQAKLAFLKLDQAAADLPHYANLDVLQYFANEDMWQEFLPIELGQWTRSDLRKMSEETGTKDKYDLFYPLSVAKLKYPSVANRSIHLWPSEVPTFA